MNPKQNLTKRFFTKAVCCQINHEPNRHGIMTLNIELSSMVDGKADFSNKIAFQCQEGEVNEVFSVFTGKTQSLSFGYHGNMRSKMLNISNTKDAINIYLRQGDLQKELYILIPENRRFELVAIVANLLAIRDDLTVTDCIVINNVIHRK